MIFPHSPHPTVGPHQLASGVLGYSPISNIAPLHSKTFVQQGSLQGSLTHNRNLVAGIYPPLATKVELEVHVCKLPLSRSISLGLFTNVLRTNNFGYLAFI